ncbi:hypothetical protein [Ureaplasma zalophigenitalium]|uniref:Uncharacterized protein n=1 Tax=Ureaplasma zalophigenitalium TaxID=907723 RepID=A0ABT3BNV0_9BACT|nr:hypothetical protein [Ureaplasma zalophigenitalium]MCV3753907.1 hypothetical protein [Ureaplasma zalophigenitalium]
MTFKHWKKCLIIGLIILLCLITGLVCGLKTNKYITCLINPNNQRLIVSKTIFQLLKKKKTLTYKHQGSLYVSAYKYKFLKNNQVLLTLQDFDFKDNKVELLINEIPLIYKLILK